VSVCEIICHGIRKLSVGRVLCPLLETATLSRRPLESGICSKFVGLSVTLHQLPWPSSLPCPICGFKSLQSVGTFSLLLLILCLASCFEATDQRLCLRLSQYMAAHQGRNLVHQIMYLAINILLANDVVKFPFTVDVFNLRDVAWPCVVSGVLRALGCSSACSEAVP
jgi:hypothetical protein